MNPGIELSIVIPCYNSSKNISILNQRLVSVLKDLDVEYEIIYVNDCSIDDHTLPMLVDISKKYENVTVIDLFSNVGQYRATMCGLQHSKGNYVITMDDDLQHPPEEIPKLYNEIKSNPEIDAVFGKYKEKKHPFIRNLGSRLIQFLNEITLNKPKEITTSSFRCMTRKTVETILSYKTGFPLIGVLILKSTRRIRNVEVNHVEREHGVSNYNLLKLIKLTINNVYYYSSLPLKYISILGTVVSLISFVLAIYYLVSHFIGKITLPGWTTIIILVNFYSGLILLSISIVGEYIIRILQEVNGAPLYAVRTIYSKPANAELEVD